jgi:hypothetical protein
MASKANAFSLNFSKEELAEQVSKYGTLKFTKTARGQCVLFFGVLNAITLAATYFFSLAGLSFYDALLEIVILYVPLLFLVWKGYRWAIIALILVWIGDKIYTLSYQLNSGGNVVAGSIFLILGICVCMRALHVENTRKRAPLSSKL